MKIIDITLSLGSHLPVWPGDPEIVVERAKSLDQGDAANVTRLCCGVHSGTHVDGPLHFIRGGLSLEALPLETFIGPAYVAHLPEVTRITPGDLEALHLPGDTERLLLRTRNSELWARGESVFTTDFVALTTEAAEWVAARGLKVIGIDYLSIQRYEDPEPKTHKTLLSANVAIIEGLNLYHVNAGRYRLVCLPLKISGAEGAPARCVLLEGE